MPLHVAFWNVQNLFAAGAVAKGPRNEPELEAKLDVLAKALDSFFEGAGPDLIGLAEVASSAILKRLADRLQHEYLWHFEPCSRRDWTGLSIMARVDRFARIERVQVYRPYPESMPRYVIARCELQEGGEPVIFVLNHWRSRLGDDAPDAERWLTETERRGAAERERRKTARALGDWLARSTRDTCVIAVGDFNAEPFEEPLFGPFGIRGIRHFSSDLFRLPAPAHLYNTAWRFLSEPDWWEAVEGAGDAYQAPRPMTTLDASPPVVLDQLLVSGRALRGGPISLQEATVRYVCVEGLAVSTERGHKRPLPWNKAGAGTGASDHFPLVATFRMNGDDNHG